jgi:class 3 adenylate cyclase
MLAIAAALAIVIPIGLRPVHGYFAANLITAATVIFGQCIVVGVAGALNIAPSLRWYCAGVQPNSRQRRSARRLVRRQSLIFVATWSAGGAAVVLLNLDAWTKVAVPTSLGAVLGAVMATSTSALLVKPTLRPVVLAAIKGSGRRIAAPGVLTRLMITWLLCSTIPCGVIAVLLVLQFYGWIDHTITAAELPALVVALTAILVGLPAMFLISHSIADPLQEVIDAMSEVEHGRIGVELTVYERSQIGHLQNGFNNMVAGLVERDMVRDLFGRHVGLDVARRAIEEGSSLSGEVSEAAVLYIDLVGSTQFATCHSPQEVAHLLNDFFSIVFHEVDERNGLINKFQGDAALAIFGVPLASDAAASDALATARALGIEMRRLPMVDFGVGVSAGSVFAGNVGAEDRYEYTVIGDPVNEAARLAELAKSRDSRALCSAAALDRADPQERGLWSSQGHIVLRGRSQATPAYAPVAEVIPSSPGLQ